MTKDSKNKKLTAIPSHKGHRLRMYAKYRESSFDNFSPHEVLEMLLYNCYPQKNTNHIAHNLINHFGNLESVLTANVDELIMAGLTERGAMVINQYHQINKYLHENSTENVRLSNFATAGQYCCDHFGHDIVESLYAICLNNNSKVIGVKKISSGDEKKTENYPLEVLRVAMVNRATNVILCHNHPSGNVEPSNTDIINSNKVADLLENAEIHLIDHIICSKDRFVSMSQRGMLSN